VGIRIETRFPRWLLAAFALAHCVAADAATLADSPPMGWNSWDAYGFTIDEADFKANAAVLAQFRGQGWQYAVVDEGWYMRDPAGENFDARHYQLDGFGRLIPSVNRFPSAGDGAGLRPLADWTHQQGLKLGIHILRGIPKAAVQANARIAGSKFLAADAADVADVCPWDEGNFGVRDNAAGQAYYDSIFRLYASWGIDFIKVDCIADHPYRPAEIRQIATAIRRAGRPMVLSLSPGPTNIAHAGEVARYAQLWRISNDVWDGWTFEHSAASGDFPNGIRDAFDNLEKWSGRARPGGWPDADMLPWGMLAPHPGWGEPRATRLTPAEQQTQFVLWAITRSPLILGCNLTQLDALTRSLITDGNLIDLNQGAWRSHPVVNLPAGYENVRAWVATSSRLRSGESVVAIFNLASEPIAVRPTWKMFGIADPAHAVVNLMTGEKSTAGAAVEVRLAPHASAVYRLQ
jgi:hypothetical protein